MIWQLPRRTGRTGTFAFDYAGLLLFACFVVSMLALLQRIQQFDPAELPLTLGLLGAAALSFLLLVRVERRLPSPLLPVDLFRDPTIWRANGMAACHGAILVSLLTFVPIYLRVVHQVSAGQTGLMLVPMTVGIGIGSIVTGQIVSRTGHMAILPSCGLALAMTGLVLVAVFAPRFSPAELAGSLGLLALFMGTVMAVVQIAVQLAAGRARIGAAAASVQYARSMGAALGTAAVAAVLFASLSWTSPEAGRLFGAVLQQGADVLAALPADRSAMIQAQFAGAFRAAFLLIAGFAALGGVFVWTLPVRRI
jgi:predicted MFS family arabinose efflux permease